MKHDDPALLGAELENHRRTSIFDFLINGRRRGTHARTSINGP